MLKTQELYVLNLARLDKIEYSPSLKGEDYIHAHTERTAIKGAFIAQKDENDKFKLITHGDTIIEKNINNLYLLKNTDIGKVLYSQCYPLGLIYTKRKISLKKLKQIEKDLTEKSEKSNLTEKIYMLEIPD